MSSSSPAVSSPSISTIGLLGVVFVTLKLCNVIAWSWLWVLAPFWGGFLIALVFAAAFFTFMALAALVTSFRRTKEPKPSWLR